jgi:hypothetical protein
MEHIYIETLRERFGGVLSAGAHRDSDLACALECEAVARGRTKSDKPVTLPDIRSLNDAYPDDASRTAAMARLVLALWDWPQWSAARRARYLGSVVEQTIRRIVPIALRAAGLEAEAMRCEREGTAQTARGAAAAATTLATKDRSAAVFRNATRAADGAAEAATAADAAAAAYAVFCAARAAVHAAYAAGNAARAADADASRVRVLDLAVDIWCEAAREVSPTT